MENLGYTGPHNSYKHTLTARRVYVWAPGSGVSLWMRLLNKHSSLKWPTCAAAWVLPISSGSASKEQNFKNDTPRPANSLTGTRLIRQGGSAQSPSDWVRVAAKGFKQCSMVLRKSAWMGCQGCHREKHKHYRSDDALNVDNRRKSWWLVC